MAKKAGIILAGGFGSRINGFWNGPKVLLHQEDVFHVAYNHIEGMRALGADDIIFVLGYKAKEVIDTIETSDWNLKGVTFITENNYEHTDKLSSTITGLGHAYSKGADEAYLVMGDHLLPYKSIMKLVSEHTSDCNKRTDYNAEIVDLNQTYMSPSNCTNVRIENDKIVKSGKGLESFDGNDIGFFMLKLPQALSEAQYLRQIGCSSWNDKVSLDAIYDQLHYHELPARAAWFGFNNKKQFEQAVEEFENSGIRESFYSPYASN